MDLVLKKETMYIYKSPESFEMSLSEPGVK